jgi:hypothetical protein
MPRIAGTISVNATAPNNEKMRGTSIIGELSGTPPRCRRHAAALGVPKLVSLPQPAR